MKRINKNNRNDNKNSNFIMLPKVDYCFKKYYSSFHLLEDTRHDMYSDKLEIHILELPKL